MCCAKFELNIRLVFVRDTRFVERVGVSLCNSFHLDPRLTTWDHVVLTDRPPPNRASVIGSYERLHGTKNNK